MTSFHPDLSGVRRQREICCYFRQPISLMSQRENPLKEWKGFTRGQGCPLIRGLNQHLSILVCQRQQAIPALSIRCSMDPMDEIFIDKFRAHRSKHVYIIMIWYGGLIVHTCGNRFKMNSKSGGQALCLATLREVWLKACEISQVMLNKRHPKRSLQKNRNHSGVLELFQGLGENMLNTWSLLVVWYLSARLIPCHVLNEVSTPGACSDLCLFFLFSKNVISLSQPEIFACHMGNNDRTWSMMHPCTCKSYQLELSVPRVSASGDSHETAMHYLSDDQEFFEKMYGSERLNQHDSQALGRC